MHVKMMMVSSTRFSGLKKYLLKLTSIWKTSLTNSTASSRVSGTVNTRAKVESDPFALAPEFRRPPTSTLEEASVGWIWIKLLKLY